MERIDPRPGPRKATLVVWPPQTPACVTRMCLGVDELLVAGAELVVCDVADIVHPDLLALDAVARMQLTARRHGAEVRLRHASRLLIGLLGLAGLDDVIRELDAPGESANRSDA